MSRLNVDQIHTRTGTGSPAIREMPTFFVYRETPNQTLTTDLWQKAAMDTVVYDSEGWYDETTNYRYTPQIAGWYQFNLECFLSASSGATVTGCAVGKNGVDGLGIFSNYSAVAGGTGGSSMCSGLLYLNGTGDYAEAFMLATGVSPSLRGGTLSLGAAPPPVTVYVSSWSGFLVRPD